MAQHQKDCELAHHRVARAVTCAQFQNLTHIDQRYDHLRRLEISADANAHPILFREQARQKRCKYRIELRGRHRRDPHPPGEVGQFPDGLVSGHLWPAPVTSATLPLIVILELSLFLHASEACVVRPSTSQSCMPPR